MGSGFVKAPALIALSSLSGSIRLGQVLSSVQGASRGETFQAALAKALGPAPGSGARPASAGPDLSGQSLTQPGVEALGAEAVALAGRLEGCKSGLPGADQAQNRIAVLGTALQSASGEKSSEPAPGLRQAVLLQGLKEALQEVRQALTALSSGEGGGSSPLPQVEGLIKAIEARLAPKGAGSNPGPQTGAGIPADRWRRVEQALGRLNGEIEAAGLTEEQKAGLKSRLETLVETLAGQDQGGSSEAALSVAKTLKDELDVQSPPESKAALERSADTLVAALGNLSGSGSTAGASSLSPWARFKTAAKALGLPLSEVVLPQENLPGLAAVLADSGFSSERVDQIMASLSGRPAGLDRVLAAVGPEPAQGKTQYTLPDSARPLLGRLLQETGADPARVQAVLKDLPANGKVSPGDLARLLARSGHSNLKVQDLQGADLSNVKDLLVELGLSASNLQTIDAELAARGGRMSMERFLSLLEAMGQPSVESGSGREEALASVVRGLTLKHSLKPEPYFNRVVTLIQAQREEPSDTASLTGRSVLQVLRSEASSLPATGSPAGAGGEEARSDPFSAGGAELQSRSAEAATGQAAGENRMEEVLRLEAGGGGTRSESTATAVTRQVSEWLVYSARNQMHHMRIQLEPPDLGEIRIYLTFRGGNLKARFVAENGFVKEALDQQAEQLKQTMAQQGLHLERFDVLTQAEQEGTSGGSKNLKDGKTGRWFGGERAASPGPAADGEQEAYLLVSSCGLSGRASGQVDLVA